MFLHPPAFDLKLLLLINQEWRNPLFDIVMPVLSSMTVLLLCVGAVFLFALAKGGRRQIVFFLILFIGMGLSDFSAGIIKDQTGRVRPLNAIAGTYNQAHGPWKRRPADFVQTKTDGTSFPSAHCANTMSLALLAMLLWPALKKWPLALPLLVGYSRIYLGKHYPTDVIAGWLLGLLTGYAVWLIWRYGFSRLIKQVA